MNRRPPFGTDVVQFAKSLPHYFLDVSEKSVVSSDSGVVEIQLHVQCGMLDNNEPKSMRKTRGRDITQVLTLTSDLEFVDFRRIP
jgi:ATP-dependent DNA helicase HFM1/MER3